MVDDSVTGDHMAKDHLRGVYDLQTQADTDAYYTAWAATYDDELARSGYQAPRRCAAALARFVALGTPVLDVGCGTGVSGVALVAAGYTNISGQDVNAEMLQQAEARGLYRKLWVADADDPFPFETGTYGALAAIGVIGVGAGPASLLGASVAALGSGGHLVFSYNDHALTTPEYADALHEVIAAGVAEELSRSAVRTSTPSTVPPRSTC